MSKYGTAIGNGQRIVRDYARVPSEVRLWCLRRVAMLMWYTVAGPGRPSCCYSSGSAARRMAAFLLLC